MLKLGEMNAKSIVNGILITGLIYVVIILLTNLSKRILLPGTSGNSPILAFDHILYLIRTWLTPILGICLLKLMCESLYKILRLSEIIINKNTKSSND